MGRHAGCRIAAGRWWFCWRRIIITIWTGMKDRRRCRRRMGRRCTAIGRVAPRRDDQWDMVVRGRVRQMDVERDFIEETAGRRTSNAADIKVETIGRGALPLASEAGADRTGRRRCFVLCAKHVSSPSPVAQTWSGISAPGTSRGQGSGRERSEMHCEHGGRCSLASRWPCPSLFLPLKQATVRSRGSAHIVDNLTYFCLQSWNQSFPS